MSRLFRYERFRPRARFLRPSAGFTLLEIINVIMIIAVVTSIAAPNASNFFSAQQAAAQASLLTNDVRLARATAIENQGYCRIVFRNDSAAWVAQQLVDFNGDVVQFEHNIAFATEPSTLYQEEPTYWRSILDEPIRELDTEVTLSMSHAPPAPIFFRYDGLIVNSPYSTALPIQVRVASFTYGDSAIQVDITPAGVVESIEYFREDY